MAIDQVLQAWGCHRGRVSMANQLVAKKIESPSDCRCGLAPHHAAIETARRFKIVDCNRQVKRLKPHRLPQRTSKQPN
jgi:hypothetical protein